MDRSECPCNAPGDVGIQHFRVRHPVAEVEVWARVGKRPVVCHVILHPVPGAHPPEDDRSPAQAAIPRAMAAFLDGDPRALASLDIDLSRNTNFQRAVLTAARRIPWGETVSYAGLARMAGRPRAIRAVASVMRRNDFPLIVPCHRVVRGNGSVGGFMGKSGGAAVRLKERLLANEKLHT